MQRITAQLTDRAKVALDNTADLLGAGQTEVVIDALLHYEQHCLDGVRRAVSLDRRLN